MPATFGTNFVCTACAPKVDSCQHVSTGCATCDEIHYFKVDLLKCANASGVEQIIGRAKDVCHSIDTMVGHTARISNQERYWPDLLEELKVNLDYKKVLLKSDYWKKFEGTVMKQGCSVMICMYRFVLITNTHTYPNRRKMQERTEAIRRDSQCMVSDSARDCHRR